MDQIMNNCVYIGYCCRASPMGSSHIWLSANAGLRPSAQAFAPALPEAEGAVSNAGLRDGDIKDVRRQRDKRGQNSLLRNARGRWEGVAAPSRSAVA